MKKGREEKHMKFKKNIKSYLPVVILPEISSGSLFKSFKAAIGIPQLATRNIIFKILNFKIKNQILPGPQKCYSFSKTKNKLKLNIQYKTN